MSSEQSINIEGDVKAWLANIGGTLIVHGNITLNQWLNQQPTTKATEATKAKIKSSVPHGFPRIVFLQGLETDSRCLDLP